MRATPESNDENVRAKHSCGDLGPVERPPPEPERQGAREKGQAPLDRAGRHGCGAPVPDFVLSAIVQTA